MADMAALSAVVNSIIHNRSSHMRISPSWVATEAMHILDPDHLSLELVYFGCHLQLRQIAREQLRSRFEDDDASSTDQHELFPELQRRYPTARSKSDGEPEYVLLESMSNEDIRYNCRRLRREARAKLAHADALEAFGRGRMAA